MTTWKSSICTAYPRNVVVEKGYFRNVKWLMGHYKRGAPTHCKERSTFPNSKYYSHYFINLVGVKFRRDQHCWKRFNNSEARRGGSSRNDTQFEA